MKDTVTEGLQTFSIRGARVEELMITSPLVQGESIKAQLGRVAALLHEREASVISVEAYGIPWNGAGSLQLLTEQLGGDGWPVTWIAPSRSDSALGGLHIWAVSGAPVEPVWLEGKIAGACFEDDSARYLRLGGIAPDSTDEPKETQARHTFLSLEKGLEAAGMTFANVVRTWFFIEDIDAWYAAFNQTRDEFFSEAGVFTHLVPASTGIGGVNPGGSALVGGLLAVQAKDPHFACHVVPSPLQGSPLDYGSSFSRAVEIASPGHRRLFVSGTASIASNGHTTFLDDVSGQIDKTWEVVEAILGSRGMGWKDVSRAIAYFKHPGDEGFFERHMSEQGEIFPVLFLHADVCRPDLLFELEVDAIRQV
jgi:enamine deaminase RidA (YjgF/YER057c/UK114 family)